MSAVTWTIKEIVQILRARQNNEFDGNIAVSGDRGNGKSTVLNKIFYRFKVFNPKVHQVYNRDDVVHLLKTQTYGICFDDEAVNTGYKRDFQNKGQQELIKILTAYRDNFNVLGSAIPNFFSLDKDLRDLFFIHFHVIERGIAVVHMPLQGRLYSQDRWDAKYNAKIEENWSKRMAKNPHFKPPYHKLSTFRGYLYFNDLTEKQKMLYKAIKKEKRSNSLGDTEQNNAPVQSLPDFIVEKIKSGDIKSTEEVRNLCLAKGEKYSNVVLTVNRRLKDQGEKTMAKLLSMAVVTENKVHNNDNVQYIDDRPQIC